MKSPEGRPANMSALKGLENLVGRCSINMPALTGLVEAGPQRAVRPEIFIEPVRLIRFQARRADMYGTLLLTTQNSQ